MTFNESNTVEAMVRDLLCGALSPSRKLLSFLEGEGRGNHAQA